MNRCIGYTKTEKKCRAPVSETRENKYFCCKNHEPFNMDFFKDGCFICSDTEIDKKELKLLKCGHIMHQPCFEEWLKDHSTYDGRICLVCRYEIDKRNDQFDVIDIPIKNWVINAKGVKKSVSYVSTRQITGAIFEVSGVKKYGNVFAFPKSEKMEKM